MKNISQIKDCYGCGVCATVCPKKIISISLNDEGFYTPELTDADSCVNCGLCVDVCAFSHEDLAPVKQERHSYAAWSKEPAVRHKCSSGGVGFELGRSLISQGYKVCGVRYNPEKQRAEHYIAATAEELVASIGSKYIQSYTVDGFKSIDRKEKYLVTGTPCQIDSFRRYIQKLKIEDNFVLMDFYCHGVPSMLVWQKYLDSVKKNIGAVRYVSWRDKQTNWHDGYAMAIDGNCATGVTYQELIKEKKCSYNSRLSEGDMFFKFFLGNMCLGKACYNSCKYKYDRSAADIRIGDLWGRTYQDNDEGVSATIAFTQKGNEILHQCNCNLTEHPFDVVAEGQMQTRLSMPKIRQRIINLLQSDNSLISIYRCYRLLTFPQFIWHIPFRVVKKIKRILCEK